MSERFRYRLINRIIVASAILSGALVAASVYGQSYAVNWYQIGGGGGISTGGVYTVNGTVGQPATSLLTGASYTLQGGFWSAVATVPTPGAPLISILPATGGFTLSWPVSATNFVLEQTLTLSSSPIAWTPIAANQYQTDQTNLTFFVLPQAYQQYFHLRKP